MRKMPRAKKMLLDNLGAENETARIEAIKRKRMIEAQKARERRANQTPEEVAARRMRDAQRARERRARLTAEQMAQQRQRDAILKRQRRAKETEAEKAIRRSLEAQKARERRARLLGKKQGIEGFCEVARMGLSHFIFSPLVLSGNFSCQTLFKNSIKFTILICLQLSVLTVKSCEDTSTFSLQIKQNQLLAKV
ncbi:hypothetical protein C0J52_22752 [Blattella germanica]|nr:hypothetical protein C0J52_22752 [Blattella germanica]